MPLYQRHRSDAMDRSRTFGDRTDSLEEAVVLLPEKVCDGGRVSTALNRRFEIFGFESCERFDRGDEGVANREVEAMCL